jgi:hypothetical protein
VLHCRPVLTAVYPQAGLANAVTRVTLTGEGFAWMSAGITTVTFDGVAAGAVLVADGSTVTCDAPALGPGTVDVALTNDHGSTTLPASFTYVDPAAVIFTMDGKAATPGHLWAVEVATLAAHVVAPLSRSATGLAAAPGNLLYAAESTQFGFLSSSNLLRYDLSDGTFDVVGPLLDGVTGVQHDAVPDLTFTAGRLVGWTEDSDQPIEIDVATGAVSIIGGGGACFGGGMAANAAGTIYLAAEGPLGVLYSVDPSTGVLTAGPTLNGGPNNGSINALTFHQGQLYGVDNQAAADPTTAANLIHIDVVTGQVTDLGSLPPGTDSIVSLVP